MILPDNPIEKQDQDQLRRMPLAKKVAEVISTFPGKESFVIGVEGKWGSGKTSFINLTLSQLNEDEIVHFTFNPWNFSDEASLLRDFFIKFSEAVEKVTGKAASKRMKDYAEKLSEIDLGISYKDVSFNPFKLLKFFSPDSSLEAVRKEIDQVLAGIDKKIVVVIDDIDRLDRKETKLILKLVKLTADFPKTIFILAYDRARVEDRITEEDNGLDGSEYLKKIIQVSFSLPLPDQQEMWAILFKDLDATLEKVYGKAELVGNEEKHWNEIFRNGFGDLFSTIRDIKRYVSSLRIDWSIMGKNDVNKVDFLSITAIRVFAPKFYEAIAVNREIFIKSNRSFRRMYRNEAEADTARTKQYQELLDSLISDKKLREHIDGICKELFPQLDSHSAENEDEWERELRICSSERFNFYVQLGIPHGDISEEQLDELSNSLDDGELFKKWILQFKEEKRLRKVLRKLLSRIDRLDTVKIKTALSVFWSLENEIYDGRQAVFDLEDVETQVTRFGYHGFKKIPQSDRKAVLAELVRGCPNLYSPLHFVWVLEDDHKNAVQRSTTSIMGEEELKELAQILVKKIESLSAAGTLSKEKSLMRILYRWKEWGSAEAVSNYIKRLISTRQGLLELLRGFVSKVLSSAGNYNTLSKKSLGELGPLDEIEQLVNAITPEEIELMSPEDKEAIDLFKNPKREW